MGLGDKSTKVFQESRRTESSQDLGTLAGYQGYLPSFQDTSASGWSSLALLVAFLGLAGTLACTVFQSASTAHSPVLHRIAYRSLGPLVDPDHQGDYLIPRRVPGDPEKGWRPSGHHGKPERQSFLHHSP